MKKCFPSHQFFKEKNDARFLISLRFISILIMIAFIIPLQGFSYRAPDHNKVRGKTIMNLTVIKKSNKFNFNDVRVSGTVIDEKGNPMAGVSVVVVGQTSGISTDVNGSFSISVPPSAELRFSFIGYKTVTVPVGERTHIEITLTPVASSLNEVVVTALGISREKKSLGYDVGEISGDNMNHVPQTNALNAIAGQVSGVVVNSTGAAPTSSVSVVIRGIRSLNNDNQPLFVVDGVPMQNSMNNVGKNNGNGNDVDYGNVLSDLNPNDIANITILKGPSAAALYGSRAGNGVVLITTKTGKKGKGLGVNFSTTNEASVPYHYFPLNLKYTVGSDPYTTPNGFNSWNGVIVDLGGTDTYRFGTPLDQGIDAIQWNSPLQPDGTYKALPMVSYNNLKNFVHTGFTTTNSVSIENSTEKDNYRFSYSNMFNTGIVATTGLTRHNLSLNVEHK